MDKSNVIAKLISESLKTRFLNTFSELFKIKNNWKNVLYIHTPFCNQKCDYCVYHSYVPSFQEKNYFYNKYLPEQIKQYKKILNGTKFDELYFGGGTPTIADSQTLERIFKNIPNFFDIPLKMIEAHPSSLTNKHIALFSKYKFRYLSMGIQTLSSKILKKQHRIVVSKKKLFQLCRKLDKTGMIYNIDLIFFLDSGELTDLKQGKEDLTYVLSVLKPVSVVIHLNYRTRKSEEKNREAIKLIREALLKYPDYICTNSLLKDKDAKQDSLFDAEYRLMRKNTDFEFYLIGKYPRLPVYGYNIVSLGYFKGMSSVSNYFYNTFRLIESRIFFRSSKLSLIQIKKIYLNYVKIRKSLKLKYFSFPNNFFHNSKISNAYLSLLKEIFKNPLISKLPDVKRDIVETAD